MEVIVAKTAGFCFGVDRAVKKAYECANKENIYSLGHIIHNEYVVKELEDKGIKTINSLDEIQNTDDATIIIRSHGVGKNVYEEIENKGYTIIDATCPYVKRIHNLVREHSQLGEQIVVIGDATHPEVQGIVAWSVTNPIIIKTLEDLDFTVLSKDRKLCIVVQTTYNYNNFQDLVDIFLKKEYDIYVFNTICDATQKRQEEAATLAKKVDAMLVIGGTHSSNTQKLFDICKKECENTYYIQTLVDIDEELMRSYKRVGITAGASTPNKIIEEVQRLCQNHLNNYLKSTMYQSMRER